MHDRPVDVLWIARYDYNPGWVLSPHNHDYFQMIFFLDGEAVFKLTDEEIQIHGGELFLLKPGETHGLQAESLLRTLDVKFRVRSGPLFRQLKGGVRSVEWNEPGLAARFERIRTEGEQKQHCYRELCGLLMEEILYLYLRQIQPMDAPSHLSVAATDAAPHDRLLRQAIAHIEDNFHNQMTVRDVAQAAGCSDRALRLHFRKTLRMTPLAFLQQRRMTKAKELIQYSDYSLKEIAQRVGLQTVHHFTRLFTSIEGSSPAAWRSRQLEGIRRDVFVDPRFSNRIFTVEK